MDKPRYTISHGQAVEPGRSVRRHLPRHPSTPPKPLTHAGFTLLELMVCVAIIAILATVAIPQFTHHMRMARTTEATLMLDVMKKGATTYYASPRTLKDGTRVPCQFPASVAMTPAAASCCDSSVDQDADGRCDEDPHAFDKPTWEALNFGLASQHVFQYAFHGSGSLSSASATLSAYGDQDCDGIMSTFHLVLDGDPAATLSGCDSTTSAGFFHDFETE
jgi:prepilin-type N-terminal cleavage/methylation domain-containing protein